MDTKTFDRQLREVTEKAEEVLLRFLPAQEGYQNRVIEAMNYSITAGGKRLRPILMLETYRMCGGSDGELIGFFMAAVEMIHTYSLVHDDLPAMDNDQYRRGKETTWYVYGDAMGILAGDGLLNYAFETALKAPEYCLQKEGIANEEKLEYLRRTWRALAVIAKKAGIYGMIGGQCADIMAQGQDRTMGVETPSAEIRENEEALLVFIHEHKTAALIQAAMMAGAILAGAPEEKIGEIEKCARNIGLAFQIQDDILDVTGDSRELGKSIGSDASNQKATYVSLKGLEQSKAAVETLSREAAEILDGFDGEHEFLRELILNLIYRRK